MSNTIKIGIAGLGTVGAGLVRALKRNKSIITSQAGARIEIVAVAELNKKRLKKLRIPASKIKSLDEILNDPEIAIIAELMGGTGIAKEFTLKALRAGKHVVSANKALFAKHWQQIFTLANRKGCAVGFEAAVMAGVPVIRSLEHGLAGNRVDSIMGILNGTTNYILSRMAKEGAEFPVILADAQRLGLCEANYSLDIDGYDAADKLAILASIALGKYLAPRKVHREGIGHIEQQDIVEAREQFGYALRPMAIFKVRKNGVEARVHPCLVPESHPLGSVSQEFNAVCINADTAGPISLIGKGAGEDPAASGVLGDLISIAKAMSSGHGDSIPVPLKPSRETVKVLPVADQESKYYLRFSVLDKPGIMSYVAGVLGDNGVSIRSCHQRERSEKGSVPLVMITHEAREGAVRKAIASVDKARHVVKKKTVAIRIEE
jgi:homoserine dehydrogenase